MADIKNKEDRSYNMSRIKGKDTGPELYLGKRLFALGYRYRKNCSSVFGHPDLWLKKYNTAVFVNGCFWHRHQECKYAYIPKSRAEFWEKKFIDNIQRDLRTKEALLAQNIKYLAIWECTIRKMKREESFAEEKLKQICDFFISSDLRLEL